MHSNACVFKNCYKWALHFGTLVITHFSSGKKLFQAAIDVVTLQISLLLNVSSPV